MARYFIDPPEVKQHEHERQNEVGDGAGDADEHALPAGMVGEGAGILSRIGVAGRKFCFVGSLGSGADLVGSFPCHFHVAAKGKQADLVVGFPVLHAEEAGAEADRKRFNAYTAKLGDGKVA